MPALDWCLRCRSCGLEFSVWIRKLKDQALVFDLLILPGVAAFWPYVPLPLDARSR